MVAVYSDYHRDRIGWFFGLRGWQILILTVASLPVFGFAQRGAWTAALLSIAGWLLIMVVTVVPVRGRSATGWFVTSVRFIVGGMAGWSVWRSKAATGSADDLAEADLPGVVQQIEIHEGPPHGPAQTRTAVIQHHTARCWAVTAQVTHPGIGMADASQRDWYGAGLATLLEAAARTELIDELQMMVRTVPDDGAERELWVTRHRRPGTPLLSSRINTEMELRSSGASVRTEAFVTVIVPESAIGKRAREHGGRLDGRARVLYGLMAEVEAHLRGAMGMTDVVWLTSPQLALVCRTGFAPAERAGIVAALAEQATNPAVNADIPWGHAGPSRAEPAVRHYGHDAWHSVTATMQLPVKGAALGALAPVLTPGDPGERRSLVVCYPILAQSVADRRTASTEWAADIGDGLRTRMRVKQRARGRDQAAKARGVDRKLARGNVLTRPYAVCCVTVPRTERIAEYGAKLDAAVRRAGFAPLRLDLAHDIGFAAATLPLGVSLTRKGTS